MAAILLAGLFVFQGLGGAALAATGESAAAGPLEPALPAGAYSPVSKVPSTSFESPAGPLTAESLVIEPTAAESPAEVLAAARARSSFTPSVPFTKGDIEAAAASFTPQSITPLADTDNNNINNARNITSSDTEYLGETVDGTATMGGGRVDVDWWRFSLAFSASSAGRIDFDLEKEAGEELWAIVYTYPDVDPFGNSEVSLYEYMNRTQDWGTISHVNITAYETDWYYMLLISPRRTGCCTVAYQITNISFSSGTPADDNNNRSRAESYNAGAPPTNREVEQNADLFDVYDMSALFTIDKTRGDYAFVNLTATVSAGRNGTADFLNFSSSPAGPSDGETVSIAHMWLFYQDPRGVWHTLEAFGTPGGSMFIAALINGTPVYAAVDVYSVVVVNNVIQDLSPIPGWVRYNITGISIFEDKAPRRIADLEPKWMLEDDPASGASLYTLSNYFSDDHDNGLLYFTVSYVQFPHIRALVSGNVLSVSSTQAHYFGNVTLQVVAHDRGYDQVSLNGDDHAAPSNYFTVEVRPVNDPPAITSLGGKTNLGSELSFSLFEDATLILVPVVDDPDGPVGSSFALDSAPPGFITFFSDNGTLILSPLNADVGTYRLVETVTDFAGAKGSVAFMIAVTNVNNNPRFVRVAGYDVSALPNAFFATQGQPFSLLVEVDDPDFLVGVLDDLKYATNRVFASITRDSNEQRNATLMFTPTNEQVGPLPIRVFVGDGAAGEFDDNLTLNIVVLNANDPPAFTSVATVQGTVPVGISREVRFFGVEGATQGNEFGMTVRATDLDVVAGHGDALTFSTDMPGKFRVAIEPDRLSADIAFTPDQSDARTGQITVLIFVQDSNASRDTLTVIIDVADVNDPPEFVLVFALNLTQDEPFTFTFQATDPDGDTVVFSTDSIILTIDSATGSVEFTPTNDLIGGEDKSFDVTITARDGKPNGLTNMVVHVLIKNANDRPWKLAIQSPVEGQTFAAGEVITFVGTADDVDKGDAANLLFVWFADDAEIGRGRTMTAGIANPGLSPKSVILRLEVLDPLGASANATLSITVNGTPKKSPGFEMPLAIAGIAAAAAALALASRRRRA